MQTVPHPGQAPTPSCGFLVPIGRPAFQTGPRFSFPLNSRHGSTDLDSKNASHAPQSHGRRQHQPCPLPCVRSELGVRPELATASFSWPLPGREAPGRQHLPPTFSLLPTAHGPARWPRSLPPCLATWPTKLIWGSFSGFLLGRGAASLTRGVAWHIKPGPRSH